MSSNQVWVNLISMRSRCHPTSSVKGVIMCEPEKLYEHDGIFYAEPKSRTDERSDDFAFEFVDVDEDGYFIDRYGDYSDLEVDVDVDTIPDSDTREDDLIKLIDIKDTKENIQKQLDAIAIADYKRLKGVDAQCLKG